MTSRILIAALASVWLSASVLAQTPAATTTTPDTATPTAATAEVVAIAEAFPTAADPSALLAELSVAKPGDAAVGAEKTVACAACHGMDGNAADPQYPKLAGQHERYIARQLALFKSGARNNPIMLGFASTLSAQDMRDVGAHFATLSIAAGMADETAISDTYSPYKGQRIVDIGRGIYQGGIRDKGVPACMACHGPTGTGNPGPSYPALGGQHAGYTGASLNRFKASPPSDPQLKDANYAVMAAIASRLTEEEILAVSSYIEGLHARAPMAATTAAK